MRLPVFMTLIVFAFSATIAAADYAPQMRLIDDLEFPDEGYCIDVRGVGAGARTNQPLVAHNCLPWRNSVDRVAVERNGRIVMPAYDACVTAIGADSVGPGAGVILRPCVAQNSASPSAQLQHFERTRQNRLRLNGTDLCLVVGPNPKPTLSIAHRWRTLTMQNCATSSLALSAWK